MFSGSIHTHSDNSLFDSVASVKQLVQRAVELGAPALALTDHGTLTGTWNFLDACKKSKIKGIVGVEFYVNGDSSREHLVVLPKNEQGFQAISKAVTESNYNIIGTRPIANFEILQKWFGEGSIGHNNVIATSACIGGVLASVFMSNENYETEQEKLRKKMEKESDPSSPLFMQLCENYDSLEKQIDDLKLLKSETKTIASKKYTQRIKRAEKKEDLEELERIKEEMAESESCKSKLPEIEKEFKAKNKELTLLRNRKKEAMLSHEKFNSYKIQIEELESRKMNDEQMYEVCSHKIEDYKNLFGEGNFYIELQYHGIPAEAKIMPILAEMAICYDVPVVASNDVHNIHREDAEGRAVMFAQKYNKWNEPESSDWELYMKTDEELSEWLLKILPDFIVKDAMRNIKNIFDQCNLNFEFKSHYPKFPCPEGAVTRLRNLIEQGKKKIPKWTSEYQERVDYELSIIEKLGFSDYLCVVEDYLNYARLVGKVDLSDPRFLNDPFNIELLKKLNEGRVGEGVGPGRGSAAGSLICYLVGITDLDPIPLNLLFERFLNPQRVTMPDIDSDIAVDIRPFVIDYVRHKYGENAVCQIMTTNCFLAKNAIRAAGRALSSKVNDGRNFYDITDEMSAMIDKHNLEDVEDDIAIKFKDNPEALEIFRFAKLIEGKMSSIGTHAAGVVISDNDDISDHLPLICVDGKMSCQCDKDRVEGLGCLKMDALGLRNLSVITDCERAILNTTGRSLSMHDIPFKKEVFQKIFQTGNTNNVFQFESDGMKKTLRDFGPDKFEDLVLLVAVYRPGPLQYISDITAVKKGEKKPDYIIPEMGRILDATYGKCVYQEQLMSIFSDFAGFTLGEADIIRRLMSKKKTTEFVKYKDKFIKGLVSRGAEWKKTEKFWEEIVNFSEYAFNQSHAAVYAKIAYVTAYLKLYYPEAYAIGNLNFPANDKFNPTLKDCLASGIDFTVPDINKSYEGFTLDGKKVIYGLSSIAGVKNGANKIVQERREHGVYRDFIDFLKRSRTPKGITEKLIKAGAFDELYESRSGLLNSLEFVHDILDKISKKETLLETETDETKIVKIKDSIKSLTDKLDNWYENISDNTHERLISEKEMLGHFISQHPIDTVTIPKNIKHTTVDNLHLGYNTLIGYISDVAIKRRRSDNKEFASFDIEDKTGKQNVVCFTDAYDTYGDFIINDSIVMIKGRYNYSEKNESYVFSVNEVTPFKSEPKKIEISVPTFEAWERNKDRILPYTEDNGDKLVVFIAETSQFIPTDFLVSKDILTASFDWNS